MNSNQSENSDPQMQSEAEELGDPQQTAAAHGNVQQTAEEHGSMQQDAEEHGNVQQTAEDRGSLQQAAAVTNEPDDRTEFHTLTTREAVRMFEDAGVPRSPRTISDWCDKTKRGESKLDAYFDTADRKYYVTPESVGRAIKEEQMKAARASDQSSPSDRGPGAERKGAASRQNDHDPIPSSKTTSESADEFEDMARKVSRLERDVLFKDAMIDHFEKNQTMLFDRIEKRSIEVGQLRSQILSLEAGDSAHPSAPDARIWEAERETEFEIEPTGEDDADAGSERVAV